MDHKPTERLHKPVKRPDPPRVSSVIEGLPTCKPKVSFQEKAIELVRSKGRLLTPSKPPASRNPITNLPFSTTGGPSSASSNPHLRTQVASDSSNPLFMSKGFSHHVQNLRERQAEDSKRRLRERCGESAIGLAGRDLAGSVPGSTPARPLDTSKGTQLTQRRQVRRTSGGKRISKAQAHAEVMEICRSAKSYIVDMAAIKRREAATLPEPNPPSTSSSAHPSSIRSDKRVSKAQPQAPLPIPQLPPQLLSTSLGSVPRGLKFTRKQKAVPEPGEITMETAETVTSSHRGIHRPGPASASRENGPLKVDVSKRRWGNSERQPEESAPRKRPRLDGS